MHQVHPLLVAVGHLVQQALHLGREAHVHEMREVLHQLLTDHAPQIGGDEVAVLQAHVFAVLQGGDDAGVGGGAADALLFQFAHQAGFAVTGRGLGELLFLVQLLQLQGLAGLQQDTAKTHEGHIGIGLGNHTLIAIEILKTVNSRVRHGVVSPFYFNTSLLTG